MTVLVFLVPAALGLGLLSLATFLWSLRDGQYDDMDGAAVRVLSDEDIGEQPAATPDSRGASPAV